jgi:hypothetical protein
MVMCAKSDCGLPPNSGATKQFISKEEYNLNYDLAFGNITRKEYNKKLKELKETHDKH